jgi:hypothetical protein
MPGGMPPGVSRTLFFDFSISSAVGPIASNALSRPGFHVALMRTLTF